MRSEIIVGTAATLAALMLASTAFAQLIALKEGAVVMGHVGLNSTSVEEHKKFWSSLGGTAINAFGNREMFQFPNIFVSPGHGSAPTGGTAGTTVDHIGFRVPDLRAIVRKMKMTGYPFGTRAEVPARYDVQDDIAFIADQKTYAAFLTGPDGMKIELVEAKQTPFPIALDHIHYAGQQADQMREWYVKVLGAKPGTRGSLAAAELPGVTLVFQPSSGPVVGTVGRVLDHVSFEVKDLAAFCQRLEAKGVKLGRPYSKVTTMDLGVAFLTDPWGTSIEFTEGYDKAAR